MTWSEIAVVVAAVVGLATWWLWLVASRLDRLHRKVGASRSVVDSQLVHRATAAAALATSGQLDPVSSVLVGEAAWTALASGGAGTELPRDMPDDLLVLLLADPRDPRERALSAPQLVGPGADAARAAVRAAESRSAAESELSATLRAVLDDVDEIAELREDPVGEELLDDLGASWYRVQLARRFHNEAVLQTQRVRRKPMVRMLRLAGHAPEPRTLELDDEWPEALGRPGVRA
ncbi:hypothetical protein [Cellulomonas composti]|uniref:Membrane protein n=1 Tax=Cellulomonas composti TaxID=266130 RepID=A0A511J7I1_9CELL|nr:hypothetical protein [Cellulomonas composti]GEL93673.1 membrane protein [Cellulomonas composti]